MDKRRFSLHVNNSLYNTPIPVEDYYTKEEFNAGYHYCIDWDGLFISPHSVEFECCNCHPNRDTIRSNTKRVCPECGGAKKIMFRKAVSFMSKKHNQKYNFEDEEVDCPTCNGTGEI